MADSNSNKEGEPTLFEILSIAPKNLKGQDPSSQVKTIKQAYRRALLQHHPDRAQENEVHFTVDQITDAYTVLSDVKRRRQYTRTLQTETKTSSAVNSTSESRTNHPKTRTQRKSDARQSSARHFSSQTYRDGVETVDLDDFSWGGKRRYYYRSCTHPKCGKSRGFSFRESELDEIGDDVGELMVECSGCSMSLKVLFGDLDDGDGEDDDDVGEMSSSSEEEEEEEEPPMNRWEAELRSPNREPAANGGGQKEPKKRGWGIKLGFGLGISLGGSAGRS